MSVGLNLKLTQLLDYPGSWLQVIILVVFLHSNFMIVVTYNTVYCNLNYDCSFCSYTNFFHQ